VQDFSKIVCIGLMILSLILMVHSFTEDSEYKIANILAYMGLFFMGAYLFYLNIRNSRKREKVVQGAEGDLMGKSEGNGKDVLRKGMHGIWVIWTVMLGSIAIYIIVCHLMAGRIDGNIGSNFPSRSLNYILYIISAVELVFGYWVRKVLLRARSGRQNRIVARGASDLTIALEKYKRALILSLSIAESIGIYGVILFFMSRNFQSLYIFVLTSAIVMLIYRPKLKEIKKLGAEIEKERISRIREKATEDQSQHSAIMR
jgi:hypothetical protein